MGDRVSVSFKQNVKMYNAKERKEKEYREESPALFHHWGGTTFPKFAFDWFKSIKKKYGNGGGDPFTRMEPRNLMVQLIAHLRNHADLRYDSFNKKTKDFDTDDELLSYSIYLGKDGNDGDNSDNGHYTIDVDTGKMFDDKGQSIG